MFDSLITATGGTSGADAAGAWARVENAACARRLAATADTMEARWSAIDSAERDQWCFDNWDAVAAEVAAQQNVSQGVASHQLMVAMALRERLTRVAEVFATGAISYRLVAAIVARTRLVQDPEACTQLDAAIAAEVGGWGGLSVAKAETAIDWWVDRFDPGALRRSEHASRGRHLDVIPEDDGSGLSYIEGKLYAHDAAALNQRAAELARGVCENDPRTIDQRRADAMGALARGADRLACGCDDPECTAAQNTAPGATVVHVIAEERSLADDTPVQLDGEPPSRPPLDKPLRVMTITEAAEALAPEPANGPAQTNPAVVIGGGIMPAPLVAAKLAATATIRPLIHPGDASPEPRYPPSRKLADFVRCRDLTCRFPGCDEPAYRCDLDHTIPYPVGPTCASNLACLCRKHHLLKTFCGWSDRQLPDGTIIWTAPGGQTYTTYPGSRLLFPTLCKPTAPVAPSGTTLEAASGLTMPRRTRTREQNRQRSIQAERKLNDVFIAERNKPPPF
ncbi:HNH endonuclease signature motif containing protein [Mycolicibacterium moriokaense]|uniref:Uncharacterized protein DUF222 n=1 Tax=Mycolicibacterium moriokaense TaxID=39691 RepID=A0A318HS46_9MYCO|nr:HNH endonuclease signature motif containing protein [Mycolicibacterium moriokaense]PXX07676.1 uncharacterized protein DUF222 [Mycolicibacterium moriokaense]